MKKKKEEALEPQRSHIPSINSSAGIRYHFKCAPISPVRPKNQSFAARVVTSKIKSPYYEIWRIFVNKTATSILENPESNVTDLRFLLGPAISTIREKYENGVIRKLEWDLYKYSCEKAYLSRTIEGFNLFHDFLEADAFFKMI